MTTELQPKLWSDDPVRQSAYFLRRIAFALLFGAAPALAPYSRRSLFLFGTIGAILLVLASLVDGKVNLRRLAAPSLSLLVFVIAGVIFVFWSGLSLAWTPFPGESGGRYATFVTIFLSGFILILFLPERVGASRLYSLSGGVAIGWIMTLGISFAPDLEIDRGTLQKSLMLLIFLLPPTIVWLIYRRRDLLALILAIIAILAVSLLQNMAMVFSLAVSFFVFLAALAAPERTRNILSYGFAVILIIAPILPLALNGIVATLFGGEAEISQIFMNWSRIVIDEPFRLLTGHGYDTILRAEQAGLIPLGSPKGMLVEVWYELGMVGAIALATFFSSLAMFAGTMTRPSAAAMLAILASAFVVGLTGGNLPQPPWLASLALAALAIAAVERGQYKTVRPRSRDIELLNAQKPRLSIIPYWLQF